jgi:hypothetical protein
MPITAIPRATVSNRVSKEAFFIGYKSEHANDTPVYYRIRLRARPI